MSHWHSSESFCWHATVYGSGFSVRTESATYIVAAVIPPIIAPSGSRGVSDYCPCRGANQAARNRGACRTAGQPANQRTGAATDHGAPPVHDLAAHSRIQRAPMPSQSRPLFYASASTCDKRPNHHHRPEIGQKQQWAEA